MYKLISLISTLVFFAFTNDLLFVKGFRIRGPIGRGTKTFLSSTFSGNYPQQGMQEDGMPSQIPRSSEPARRDVCQLLITGVVGTDPRENYLKNGHYVLSFSVGVVGHFLPVHDWEKYKPTETMWVQVEVWDDEAQSAKLTISKGATIAGLGCLIHNKWVDKQTGEERKQFKLRLFKFMDPELIREISSSLVTDDSDSLSTFQENDSGFTPYSPSIEDQTSTVNDINSKQLNTYSSPRTQPSSPQPQQNEEYRSYNPPTYDRTAKYSQTASPPPYDRAARFSQTPASPPYDRSAQYSQTPASQKIPQRNDSERFEDSSYNSRGKDPRIPF